MSSATTCPSAGSSCAAKPDGTGDEALLFGCYAPSPSPATRRTTGSGPFTEAIRRGAFKKPISDVTDVAFLVNHGGLTMARTKSGTLRLSEDGTCLHAEADLDAVANRRRAAHRDGTR